jgi:hypothetical protein
MLLKQDSVVPTQASKPASLPASTVTVPHVPLLHDAPRQLCRQLPQLAWSVRRLTSQPVDAMPSQSRKFVEVHEIPHDVPSQVGVELGPDGHAAQLVPHVLVEVLLEHDVPHAW